MFAGGDNVTRQLRKWWFLVQSKSSNQLTRNLPEIKCMGSNVTIQNGVTKHVYTAGTMQVVQQ